jgi:hypothetical protein
LENNALPNLTRLFLSGPCGIGDDGFIALVLALVQNTSVLHFDLSYYGGYDYSQEAFEALALSLPNINVLQQFVLSWCSNLES